MATVSTVIKGEAGIPALSLHLTPRQMAFPPYAQDF